MSGDYDSAPGVGSWVRKQVAFYDWLFAHAGDSAERLRNAKGEGFADGAALYEEAVTELEHRFPTFAEAWEHYLDFSREGASEL